MSGFRCNCLTCISNSVTVAGGRGPDRPQFGFPRLRVVTGREAGIAMSPDDTPPSSTRGIDVMEYSPARMKKAPERVRGLPHFLAGSVCTSQAAIVPAFFCVISSSARSQSSSS
jgi:hypothetical protein